ncbi:MAG: hypothetical protein PHQ23_06825 [Candidatus Wallbacteria bacterium]|nr:hypothetical protein [Candidatus Wallbacteria bacterium]
MEYALIVLFGLTILYISATSRLEVYINCLFIQGMLLFLLILLTMHDADIPVLLLLILETLGLKAILVPWFLRYIIRSNHIYREAEASLPHFYSVVLTTMIFIFSFFVAWWSTRLPDTPETVYFGVSIAVVLNGLLIILTRHKIITHVMGFMIVENGTFLLSLAVAREMPLIVNLGILLDIFVAVFLLGIMVTRIRSTFEELDIDMLTTLKD